MSRIQIDLSKICGRWWTLPTPHTFLVIWSAQKLFMQWAIVNHKGYYHFKFQNRSSNVNFTGGESEDSLSLNWFHRAFQGMNCWTQKGVYILSRLHSQRNNCPLGEIAMDHTNVGVKSRRVITWGPNTLTRWYVHTWEAQSNLFDMYKSIVHD